MGFNCHKRGHNPMEGVPEQVFILEGFPHVGRVCRACKGAYYEQLSDVKFEESSIVDAKGKTNLIEVDNG